MKATIVVTLIIGIAFFVTMFFVKQAYRSSYNRPPTPEVQP